jgi:hypothetical protein
MSGALDYINEGISWVSFVTILILESCLFFRFNFKLDKAAII